jgi:disulfide bond formation protein DsbB
LKYASLAWLGSLVLILSALFFQYGKGLDPCVLCMWQRYPHYVAILIGLFAVKRKPHLRKYMGVIVLASAAVAMFHVGVEQKWWEGLSTCAGNTEGSVEDLLGKPVARCDEIAWSLFGLSMAAWNGIISLVIAGMWFKARD